MFNEEIETRVTEAAEYVSATGATVRATAEVFGISKSTVHKDLTERLKTISPELYVKVSHVLAKNRSERHIRGGMATKNKYKRNQDLSENSNTGEIRRKKKLTRDEV
jgi:putative DeoR family transcriptional regulator (stage III sporulation protein D)